MDEMIQKLPVEIVAIIKSYLIAQTRTRFKCMTPHVKKLWIKKRHKMHDDFFLD